MKAFLSHSSKDNEFVEAVQKELGRQFSIYDKHVFDTGDEFKSAIEKGLDDASIFVLFASSNSKASIWVDFEKEEAWYRKLQGKLSQSLVYIIDSSIDESDLPEWLKRGKVSRDNVPKSISRDIQARIQQVLEERQHPIFIGRGKEIAELEEALTTRDEGLNSHIVFVTGLPGIGRRSLIRHAIPSILSLRKFIFVRIDEGDSLHDICIKIADLIEPYNTEAGLKDIISEIRTLNAKDALDRLIRNFGNLIDSNVLPVFIDAGGLLDADGYITDAISQIIKNILPTSDIYLSFVSARRPQFTNDYYSVIHLASLSGKDIKKLLSLLAHRAEKELREADLTELAKYTAGYPPSAFFSIEYAKKYGINVVLQYKNVLTEFRSMLFLDHLSQSSLNENEIALLRILAFYSPLPSFVITKVLKLDDKVMVQMIIKLIDLAFVVTTDDGFYSIADPIKEAVYKAFGFPSEPDHLEVTTNLYEYLKKDQLDIKRLELSKNLFRAARLTNNEKATEFTVHLASDLIALTEQFYHMRQFQNAIKVGYHAIEERPTSIIAQSYLIRALIQEEQFEEAEQLITNLKKIAPMRDVYFLTGFLEIHRGKIDLALQAYTESEKNGRRGIAIKRELANCYLLLGDIPKASTAIKEAVEKHGDNPYIIDLWVQIVMREGNVSEIEKALDRLQLIDEARYFFRKSRYEFTRKNIPEALKFAKLAFDQDARPPFKFYAQLAYCLMDNQSLPDAEALLNRMDSIFTRAFHDIRTSLRCRLEIAKGHYSAALQLSSHIDNKTSLYYQKLRRDALMGELEVSALTDRARSEYKQELIKLDRILEGRSPEEYSPTDKI